MPTNPTLPTLDGESRELRDRDRVRLFCGREVTVRSIRFDGHDRFVEDGIKDVSALDSYCHYWETNGLSLSESRDFDIVLILGPDTIQLDAVKRLAKQQEPQ